MSNYRQRSSHHEHPRKETFTQFIKSITKDQAIRTSQNQVQAIAHLIFGMLRNKEQKATEVYSVNKSLCMKLLLTYQLDGLQLIVKHFEPDQLKEIKELQYDLYHTVYNDVAVNEESASAIGAPSFYKILVVLITKYRVDFRDVLFYLLLFAKVFKGPDDEPPIKCLSLLLRDIAILKECQDENSKEYKKKVTDSVLCNKFKIPYYLERSLPNGQWTKTTFDPTKEDILKIVKDVMVVPESARMKDIFHVESAEELYRMIYTTKVYHLCL